MISTLVIHPINTLIVDKTPERCRQAILIYARWSRILILYVDIAKVMPSIDSNRLYLSRGF